jgi:hypothetical protein
VGCLANCPSIFASKSADDELRRQFASGDAAAPRSLDPHVGLVSLYDGRLSALAPGATIASS